MSEKSKIKNEAAEILQLVGFKIAEEEYAVDILMVQEIIRMMQVTKVPNAPDFVDGVVNLRGRIIPVIDLRSKLGLSRKEVDKDKRIIVVEVSGKTVGFIVDAVTEVLRIPASITEPPPDLITNVNSEFIKAVGKLEDRLLILIDLEKILSSNEKLELSAINNEE
ncbi:MAG: chemotaxis protein CheW [Melioribacter sp.]|uniref:chemotaxis protein CheW n=1 Tax=Rosettibacter primus TaxID=3111523 RepID=UPI00247D2CB4|nr:chemotaxis protein CheW [Melioribacter sp.]